MCMCVCVCVCVCMPLSVMTEQASAFAKAAAYNHPLRHAVPHFHGPTLTILHGMCACISAHGVCMRTL